MEINEQIIQMQEKRSKNYISENYNNNPFAIEAQEQNY